jgi:hypothetical protein
LKKSSAEPKSTILPEPLQPGQSQEFKIEVQADKEQETIDIVVRATDVSDSSVDVKRQVRVVR